MSSYTSPVPATSVLLVHNYENGAIASTDAVRRPGTRERSSDFYPGAWLRADKTVFFVFEDGQIVEAPTPGELAQVVTDMRKRRVRAA